MNRGGLAGTVFELDDRFTGYDAQQIERVGFQGGKMLVRVDPDDAGSVATLEACAHAISDLADRGLMAMVEPFMSQRADGRVRNDERRRRRPLRRDRGRAGVQRAHLAQAARHRRHGPGARLDDAARPAAGGEVSADQDAQFARWKRTLAHPQVRGMVVGRSLLYPPDGDVAAAVDTVLEMMRARPSS